MQIHSDSALALDSKITGAPATSVRSSRISTPTSRLIWPSSSAAKYSCGISHGQGIQEFAGHEQLFQHLLGESHTHEQLLDWADALGLFLMTIEGKDE